LIIDMNGDGALDVIKNSTLGGNGVDVAYNNPANLGHFNIFQTGIGTGAPYHVDAADLNKDGRPDIICSDDGADSYRYNTGNDGLGRVVWGGLHAFSHQDGSGDDGFAGSNHIFDLDLDGFPEALVTSVDIDVPGCDRRGKIYHNRGGAVGSEVVLTEEAQQTGSGGWKGVVGMSSSDTVASFDVTVFDIDNDGDPDMVWGLCAGTKVWLNNISSCPILRYGTALPSSIGKPGVIGSLKTSSLSHNHLILTAHDLPPNKTALFLYGTTQLGSPVPFGNGNRWVGGPIQRFPATASDANGKISYPVDFTTFPLNTLVVGDTRYFQCWFRDPAAGGLNSNVTDAEAITVCP
jgi:hypothetical protein